MTSQRLATELILRIVETLGEGSRQDQCIPALIACITANSALLRTSQEIIVREVSLYSHPRSVYKDLDGPIEGLSRRDIDDLGETTRLFLRSVKASSHLRSYVKDITFRICDASEECSRVVHHAIRTLPNVVMFDMGLYNVPGDFGLLGMGIDQDTLDTIVWLMQHAKLETLRVEAFLAFPWEVLRASTGLKTLILSDCALGPGKTDFAPG